MYTYLWFLYVFLRSNLKTYESNCTALKLNTSISILIVKLLIIRLIENGRTENQWRI